MEAIPIVVPAALRPVVGFRARAGLKPPCRATADDLAYPLAAAGDLFADLATELGDDAIGLSVGAATGFEETPLGRHVAGALTIGAGLSSAISASSLFCGGQQIWMTQHADAVWLYRRHARVLDRGRRQANDFALQMLIDFVRRGGGPPWRPKSLHLEGPPPAHAEELAALATGSTRFGAKADCLVFPASILALPLGRAATGASPPLPSHPSFEASIRQAIRYLLEADELSLPSLAEIAGTSVRTLQRRLAHAGISFARLVDEARFDVAARLLEDPTIRIIDISNHLQYTDAANFTRAFRRWAGVSPMAFRRSCASASMRPMADATCTPSSLAEDAQGFLRH